jgi:hypothetical protein
MSAEVPLALLRMARDQRDRITRAAITRGGLAAGSETNYVQVATFDHVFRESSVSVLLRLKNCLDEFWFDQDTFYSWKADWSSRSIGLISL